MATDRSPSQILRGMLAGRTIATALSYVAELGVVEHMGDAPTPVATLATRTGVSEDGLFRVLRALAALGVFAEAPDRAFALTPVSRLLRADEPGSLRGMARWTGEPARHAAWGAFDHAVRTGQPAFDHVHGVGVFEYFAAHPAAARIFDDAMSASSATFGAAVAAAYDFGDVTHLVDIGGSHGVLLGQVLARYPDVRATLFDLPHVVEAARARLAADPHGARIETVAGSFLEGVPPGADAYIMKSIIHDWDDAHCLRILTHCRQAMAPGGRVLVVEGLVTDGPDSVATKLLDLEMLVMTTGGRERTEAEMAALFARADLKLTRVVPTASPMSVLEARAAS